MIVEATNRRYTQVKIFETIITALEGRLAPMDALPDRALWESPSVESADERHANVLESISAGED